MLAEQVVGALERSGPVALPRSAGPSICSASDKHHCDSLLGPVASKTSLFFSPPRKAKTRARFRFRAEGFGYHRGYLRISQMPCGAAPLAMGVHCYGEAGHQRTI